MKLNCLGRAFPVLAGLLAGALLLSDHGRAEVSNVQLRPISVAPPADPGLPLVPTRRLTFTTTEGTWMSLDVSPDGQTLVFDLLGDLYRLPVGGGKAVRLTQGMAVDCQPRFSPDGQRIVFVSDRSGDENLWILTLDGKPAAALTNTQGDHYQSPEWTPDGKSIVVSKTRAPFEAGKPWLYDLEGGEGRKLTETPADRRFTGFAFGAEPQQLWFAFRKGEWEYNGFFPQWQLGFLDRTTGRQYMMSATPGSAFRPALSPDGRWLVFGSRRGKDTGLRVRNLQTGQEDWLAYPVHHDQQELRATEDVLPGYSFTPDSKAVVISYGGGFWKVPVEGGAPGAIAFSADVDLPLGPPQNFSARLDADSTLKARRIRDISFSPDGKRLAFSAINQVWVMDYPKGKPRRLTDSKRLGEGEFQPTWSPDGRWIAYTTFDDSIGGHLYKVAAGGATPRKPVQLTRQRSLYQDPVWSPDGARIVAVRGKPVDEINLRGRLDFAWLPQPLAQFVWVSAHGGDAAPIANAGDRSAPHFTADRERIFVSSSSEGLVSFRWDGTDEKAHLKLGAAAPASAATAPAPPTTMAGRAMFASAQADRALVASQGRVFLVDLDPAGATKVSLDPPSPAVRQLSPSQRVGHSVGWSDGGRKAHWVLGNTVFESDLSASAPPRETKIEVAVKRDIPQGAVVLSGARVITMKGDEVLERADIVIRDNRIASIHEQGAAALPAGARIVEVGGKTIMPGFVDLHTHTWTWDEAQQPSDYLANLAYGVTTLHEVGGGEGALGLADKVEAGITLGPRMIKAAYAPPRTVAEYARVESTFDNARHLGQRTVKMFTEYLNRRTRQWSAMGAQAGKLRITAHTGWEFKTDIATLIDGYSGHEHVIPVFPAYGDLITLFAATGMTYTPTMIGASNGPAGLIYFLTNENPARDPKLRRFTPQGIMDGLTRPQSPSGGSWFAAEEYHFSREAQVVRDIVAAGGRVGVGGHGNLQGLGTHWELWMMASGGLPNHDALRAATLFGAQAVGFAQDLGSLEPGKLADLLVLDANPLENLRNTNTIRYVMKNGRLYEGDTLDEIWPQQRKLPAFDWQTRGNAPASTLAR